MSVYAPDFFLFRARQALLPLERRRVRHTGGHCGAYLFATPAPAPTEPQERLWSAHLEAPSGYLLLEATHQVMTPQQGVQWFEDLLTDFQSATAQDPGPAQCENAMAAFLLENWPNVMGAAQPPLAQWHPEPAFHALCGLPALFMKTNDLAPAVFELLRAELPGLTRAENRFTAAATVLGDIALSLQDGVRDLASVLAKSMEPGQTLHVSDAMARDMDEGIAQLQASAPDTPRRYCAADLVEQLVPPDLREDLIAQLS